MSSSTRALSRLLYCFGIRSCGRIRAVRDGRAGCCFHICCLADAQNTVLAAWLCFSPAVLYPYYSHVPRLDGLSALDDQAAAGVLMWVPGSIAFLLPLFWIGVSYLLIRIARSSVVVPRAHVSVRSPLPQLTIIGAQAARPQMPAFDLLFVPLIGLFFAGDFLGRFCSR